MPELDQFMQDIKALKVSSEILGQVMIMWASLSPDEWKDFDRRLQRVVEFVGEKDRGEGAPMLAMAVTLRLMALDTMAVDPASRGWLLPGARDGITYIHGDLLKAAAEEIILAGPQGEPTFAPEGFRIRLMELTAVHGQA